MNIETANYIIQFFPRLMTKAEGDALRHSNSMFKLLSPEDHDSIESYKARVKFFKDRNLITEDPTILSLRNEGREDFYIKTATRIFQETPDKIFFNHCPNCNQLARTPYARQCRHCGHSWHDSIKANFKINNIFEFQSKPDLLFFVGRITSGVIQAGMKIDLTFIGISNKPTIESIEPVDHDYEQHGAVLLGVYIPASTEKDYIKNHGVLAIPIIIE
jgi:hypothetical protein